MSPVPNFISRIPRSGYSLLIAAFNHAPGDPLRKNGASGFTMGMAETQGPKKRTTPRSH